MGPARGAIPASETCTQRKRGLMTSDVRKILLERTGTWGRSETTVCHDPKEGQKGGSEETRGVTKTEEEG